MAPAFGEAILAFAKGSEPPLKLEGESSDDFQTRSIEWLKVELKSMRGLLWVVLAMQLAQWLGPVAGY